MSQTPLNGHFATLRDVRHWSVSRQESTIAQESAIAAQRDLVGRRRQMNERPKVNQPFLAAEEKTSREGSVLFLQNFLFGLPHVKSGTSLQHVLVQRLPLQFPSAFKNNLVPGLSIISRRKPTQIEHQH